MLLVHRLSDDTVSTSAKGTLLLFVGGNRRGSRRLNLDDAIGGSRSEDGREHGEGIHCSVSGKVSRK
jgi:hypothetical protein